MKVQVITDSELQALIGGGYNELYNPPSDDKVCCEGSPSVKDLEQSFKITAEKYNQQWADIMDDIDDYWNQLDDLSEFCGEFEERIAKLEKINWSKVGTEKRDELFSQIQKILDISISRKNAMEAQFHRFCDSMEEIIFSLLSYKKQNKYCEEKIERLIVEKFSKYKVFVEIMKERFGFERSEEQKARRTERLKQLE